MPDDSTTAITTSRPASTRDETIAFVSGGDDTMLTVLTRPTAPANGIAVVIGHGAGDNSSLQGNRLWVRLARRLASEGFTVARFDFHGAGDSSGVIDRISFDDLFTSNVDGVWAWMEELGCSRIAFVGTCFGARTSLALSIHDRRPVAFAAILMPVRDYAKGEKYSAPSLALVEQTSTLELVRRAAHWERIKRLANPRYRRLYWKAVKLKARKLVNRSEPAPPIEVAISPTVREGFKQLVEQHVPILMVNGAEDLHHKDLVALMAGPLAPFVTGQAPAIEVQTTDGYPLLDGFPSVGCQNAVIEIVSTWLKRVLTSD